MKNALENVNEQIQEMLKKKADDLAEIQQKQKDLKREIAACEEQIRQATEAMDLDAFQSATAAKNMKKSALTMYAEREKQIARRQFITEEESDRAIDSLLAYEDDLATAFKEAAAEHLNALSALFRDYTQGVKETEQTIAQWTRNIHPNYRGAGWRTDPDTGKMTHRMEKPVPVHSTTFIGCPEALTLKYFLIKLNTLLDEENMIDENTPVYGAN